MNKKSSEKYLPKDFIPIYGYYCYWKRNKWLNKYPNEPHLNNPKNVLLFINDILLTLYNFIILIIILFILIIVFN